jgi:hypothetical protein
MSTVDSFSSFLNDTTRISTDLLNAYVKMLQSSFSSVSSSGITQSMTGAMNTLRKAMPQAQMSGGCGCTIPPPCWAPKPMGDITSHICAGSTATLRIRVTNCGYTRRAIRIEAPKESGITVTPAGLELEPLERAYVSLSIPAAADAAEGSEKEYLVWVRGCNNHYLRWTVRVTCRGGCSCHEIAVEDCPELVHHWYDHFYCRRPCTNRNTQGG